MQAQTPGSIQEVVDSYGFEGALSLGKDIVYQLGSHVTLVQHICIGTTQWNQIALCVPQEDNFPIGIP